MTKEEEITELAAAYRHFSDCFDELVVIAQFTEGEAIIQPVMSKRKMMDTNMILFNVMRNQFFARGEQMGLDREEITTDFATWLAHMVADVMPAHVRADTMKIRSKEDLN